MYMYIRTYIHTERTHLRREKQPLATAQPGEKTKKNKCVSLCHKNMSTKLKMCSVCNPSWVT